MINPGLLYQHNGFEIISEAVFVFWIYYPLAFSRYFCEYALIKVSSIQPKFDNRCFVDLYVLYKLQTLNRFCFDLICNTGKTFYLCNLYGECKSVVKKIMEEIINLGYIILYHVRCTNKIGEIHLENYEKVK